MRRSPPLGILALTLAVLPGCTATSNKNVESADPGPVEFELIGSWEYTGGMDALTNSMEITADQVVDSGDYQGTGWTITFSVESWDNDADQALWVVSEIDGFSHYDVGEGLHTSWQLDGETGDFYFDTDGNQEPTGGTEGSDFFTYTRS